MIEEQYVTFETAKLAKEKGFDIPTRYGFSERRSLVRVDTSDNWNQDKELYSRPTQSLLARWLREVHDISVAAYRTWAMDNSYNYEILVGTDFEKMIREECECDRTYEEAMEAGLQEALKLIN